MRSILAVKVSFFTGKLSFAVSISADTVVDRDANRFALLFF
jgi:hypothetical protein